MKVRESIYVPLGYKVSYKHEPRYRGSDNVDICHAERNGIRHIALKDKGHFTKIMAAQNLIPHMAKFSEPSQNHILMEFAPGELIWHLDAINDISNIERQLLEFATATKANGFSHRDIRPWNVFLNGNLDITVIDWGNSVIGGCNIDSDDANRFVRLLKGEMLFQDAWGWHPRWYPAWCKHR